MEIILIACCASKAVGGTSFYNGSGLSSLLPSASIERLMKARLDLAASLNEVPGPDLGGNIPKPQAYLPALERYTGIVYERSRVRTLYPVTKDLKILIISALYGLLDANDPIRWYNHEMKNTNRSGTRLFSWWKERHLGKIVQDTILALQPTCIHCLLPQNYQKALDPWTPAAFGKRAIEYISYEHPGMGIGILNKWGADLENILLGKL